MDNFNASQVMSGTQGEIWIDGQYMAEVTAFKAEIKLIKEEVNQVKRMFKQYKITGCEGSGNVKLNHVSSFFIDLWLKILSMQSKQLVPLLQSLMIRMLSVLNVS